MRTYSGHIIENDNVYKGFEDDKNPYSINCCGYIKFITKDAALQRKRVDYYLIYIMNGFGYYKIKGKEYKVPAGSIVLYRPGDEQDYYYLHEDQTELFWIHFSGYAVNELLRKYHLSDNNIYSVGIQTECINLFNKVIHEMQIKNPLYEQSCVNYFLNLLLNFSRTNLQHQGDQSFKNSFIEATVKKMHIEYQNDHPVNYYAKQSNLSVYQFIHKFKELTGTSPMKYIERIRIDKSKELLTNTDLTVTEVADIVGYNNPFYFSRVFKKNTGSTPSAYRIDIKTIKPNGL